jgi:hypothetical protein
MLEPLKQFICDKCGGTINSPRDGWVEWLEQGDDTMFNSQYGFKIVHANPKCYFYPDPEFPGSLGMPLIDFTGASGYIWLLCFLDLGPLVMENYKGPRVRDMREFVELMRRLTLPYYEEVRQYAKSLRSSENFVADDSFYEQENLKKIIEEFANDR